MGSRRSKNEKRLTKKNRQSHSNSTPSKTEEANCLSPKPSTAQEIPEPIRKILEKLGIDSREVKGWFWLFLTFLLLMWKILEQLDSILHFVKSFF